MSKKICSLDDNIKAYESMSERLERDYPGKVVVIYDGNFYGSYDSVDNAAKEAIKNLGAGPYLMRQVGMPGKMAMPASIAYKPYSEYLEKVSVTG